MDVRKIVAICQFGGEFTANSDGTLSYSGGEAHAVSVTKNMSLDDFRREITSRFNLDLRGMSFKYFLPGNKRTLITLSNDKDLHGMVEFSENALTTEVYVIKKADNRLNRSTVADSDTVQKKRKNQQGNARTPKSKAKNASESGAPTAASNAITVHNTDGAGQNGLVASANLSIRSQWPSVVEDLDNRVTESMLFDLSTPPVASVASPLNVRPLVSNSLWDDVITGVGQEFDNANDFREQLCKYAISKGFIYKYIKNVNNKVTAVCNNDQSCTWRIHASMPSHKQKLVIKTLNDVHTCGGGNGKDGQRRTTRQWLTSIIKEKLQYEPQCKPRDIAKEIYENYGVTLTYHQVWRGKEDAQKELYSNLKETFSLLPWYCDKIMETNPGSVAILYTSVDSKFRRFFVSYHASIHGFELGCRPLVFLDRIPLKSSNQCKLLAAATVDGNDADFPIAFAVVEDETYDTWLWFLAQLRYTLTKPRPITFISKWQKGLAEAVPQVFPDSYHGQCLHPLMEELKGELKKGPWSQQQKHAMADDFTRAAQACTVEEFNSFIESIATVSSEVAEWVKTSKPETWSDAFFKGARYDHLSSNVADAFSDWIPSKCESFIVQMVDAIQNKLMDVMHARRETSNSWSGPLTPSMEEKLQEEIPKARKLNVICSSDTVFEVRGSVIYVVNIREWSCSCRRWQVSGLPCNHSIAVFSRLGRSVYDYCSDYFKIDCHRTTYCELIQPIPDIVNLDFNTSRLYLPPPASHPPGQPRRKRFKPRKTNRPWHCSRCKMAGHNRATCEAVL